MINGQDRGKLRPILTAYLHILRLAESVPIPLLLAVAKVPHLNPQFHVWAASLTIFNTYLLNRRADYTLIVFNRDDRIRTCGPFVPNEVRYQAALHPENFQLNHHSIFCLEWVETC